MPGFASRLIGNDDRYPDPEYRQRLRDFMQEINPKPEHVLADVEEIQKSNRRDMIVYASMDSGELVAHVTVWADSLADAIARAGELLPDDLPLGCNISVCSPEVFEDVKRRAANWTRLNSWAPKHK